MNQQNLVSLVERIAAELGLDSTTRIQLDSVITELGIDSLAMAQIVLELEAALGVTIPDDALLDVVTVEDLVRIVEVQLAAGSSRPLDGPAQG